MIPADRTRPRRTGVAALGPLRALGSYVARYKWVLCAGLLVLVLSVAAQLSIPLLLRQLIDHGLATRDTRQIDIFFAGFLAAAALFGIFSAIRYYIVNWLGERVVADIRAAVYQRVIRMDPAFFDSTKTGEVMSRLTADTTLVQSIAGPGMSVTLRSIITGTGALVGLACTNVRLTTMVIVVLAIVILPTLIYSRRARTLSRTSQDRVADASGMADESIASIQTVQSFTLEKLHIQRFHGAIESAFTTAVRLISVRSVLVALSTILVIGGIAFVLWIGAHDVLRNRMTYGELGQFVFFATYIGISATSLSEMWADAQRAAGAMERLSELLALSPAIRCPDNPEPLLVRKGSVRFSGVTFSYPSRPEVSALERFDLNVSPGESIALVGPSGAGKSTVFNLLLRFYDPAAGTIHVDDVDIAKADPHAVRSQIGLVAQESILFSLSIRENIRQGRPTATDEEVEAAAHAAAADGFIRAMPQGYDTLLGERGTRLSGGQRQRVAIARAILKNPPILLLDEATNSLDADNEHLVQQALAHLMQHRTTIIIAHRLSTVLKAKCTYVMEHGRIAAAGTHEALLDSSPLYARLAALQFTDPKFLTSRVPTAIIG